MDLRHIQNTLYYNIDFKYNIYLRIFGINNKSAPY